MHYEIRRGLPLILHPSQEVYDYLVAEIKACNYASTYFQRNILPKLPKNGDKTVTVEDLKLNFKDSTKNGKCTSKEEKREKKVAKLAKYGFDLTDIGYSLEDQLAKACAEKFTKLGLTSKSEHANVAAMVVNRYIGYRQRFLEINRNDPEKQDPGAPIKFKPKKGVTIRKALIGNTKDGKLSFPYLFRKNGKFVDVGYNIPDNLKDNVQYLPKHKRRFGGILKIVKWNDKKKIIVFVRQYTTIRTTKYEPKGWIALDMNDSKEWWITTVDSTGRTDVIDKTDKIIKVEEKISAVNKLLRDRSILHGGVRRWHNNLREKLHAEHRKLVVARIEEKLILPTEALEFGIIPDPVTTGQTRGTWGQDKVTPFLITICENRGIPFKLSKVKNTSRRCSNCGEINKQSRKSTLDYKCISCGFTMNAHFNACCNCLFQIVGIKVTLEETCCF